MNGKKRAKSTIPEIKNLITIRAITSKEDRETLADELIKEISLNFPDEIPPAWETLIKAISRARNHEKNPLDNTWHMGTLEENPLPAEAIPFILKVKKVHEKESDILGQLTIRQAFWISRLYTTIKDVRDLGHASYIYSMYEIICSISNTPFDTSKLDHYLLDYGKRGRLEFNLPFIVNNLGIFIKAYEKQTGISWNTHKENYKRGKGK